MNNESITAVNDVSKDFIYVRDVAHAVLAAILKNNNEIYNIASGNKITIKEIANKITKLTGSKSKTEIIEKQGEYDMI